MSSSTQTVATSIARFLADSGVKTIYGLTGSHIKPIWEEASKVGIRIVDVRHEVAAVHMAQAEADLTGELAVATVTCGPGMTNAVTGITAAHIGRSPILVLSAVPPLPQLGLGALEEIDQAELVRSVTRFSRTVTSPRQLLPFLHEAFAAAVGDDGLPGPAFLDLPTDVLRGEDPWSHLAPVRSASRRPAPLAAAPSALDAARAALASARRTVVISGRGANAAGPELVRFLEATGALYLDTTESRGLVPVEHDACVPAMRSRVFAEADTIITLGRRFDFSLGFGSPVVFPAAKHVIRIGRSFEDLTENRPGDVRVKADPALALQALLDGAAAGSTPSLVPDADTEWLTAIKAGDRDRRSKWSQRATEAPLGPDGAIHPNALIHAINEQVAGSDAVLIADGGDILSFARVGLNPPPLLDTGTFGCLGVGVPFAAAAALLNPDKPVIALVGDGSFGFNAMELDSIRRSGAKPVIVISNNEAWNIERHDHVVNYADNPRYNTSLPGCRYDLLAQSLGVHGERVTELDRLPAALADAITNAPAVLDVRTSREVQSGDFTNGLADLAPLHVLTAWSDAEQARIDQPGPNG